MTGTIIRTRMGAVAFAIILAITGMDAPAATVELTAVEKPYVELNKLDPAQHQKRLEEGAMKEGGFAFINSRRGPSAGAISRHSMTAIPSSSST